MDGSLQRISQGFCARTARNMYGVEVLGVLVRASQIHVCCQQSSEHITGGSGSLVRDTSTTSTDTVNVV